MQYVGWMYREQVSDVLLMFKVSLNIIFGTHFFVRFIIYRAIFVV